MISSFALYCWLMLDSVEAMFFVFTMFSLCLSLVLWMAFNEVHLKLRWPVTFSIITVIMSIALFATPSTKQAAIIFGVPYIINKAEDINADKIPVKIVDYLNAYLDKEVKELKEKSK